MKIKRTSILSNKVRELDLDITEEQIQAHKNGGLVQDVFPNLNEDEREFYLTGIIPEEWDEAFSRED